MYYDLGICQRYFDGSLELPEFMKLKQVLGYFTPEGIIALWLGVPTFVITALVFLVKRTIKLKNLQSLVFDT